MKYTTAGALVTLIMTNATMTATTVFTEDFSDFGADNKQIQWDANWIGVGNNNGAQYNSTNQNLDSLFGYRGATNITSTGSIAVGQTVTIQLDYNWVLSGEVNNNGTTFGLTNNITEAGTTYMAGTGNANTLGFRMQYNLYPGPLDGQPTDDGNIKMLSSFSAVNNDTLLRPAEDFGYSPRTAADFTGDTMRLTYSATKTATADTWLVDMTMLNLTTSVAYTKNGVSVVNAAAYNATDLYFTFQENSGLTMATSTLDNISLTVVPEPSVAMLAMLGIFAFRRRRN